MKAASLFDLSEGIQAAEGFAFGGSTYDYDLDGRRLGRQLRTVIYAMRDGRFRTLREIANVTGYPEASISARLRDVRKRGIPKLTMHSRRRRGGLWEYRIGPVTGQGQLW
jgi:hypothetical protein